MNLAAFESWLKRDGYQPSTVRQTVAGVRGLQLRGVAPGEATVANLPLLKRYARWAGTQESIDAWARQAVVVAQAPRSRRRRRPERLREARSYSEADWRRLLEGLAKGREHEDTVLLVMAATSLRVSDTLQLKKSSLVRALETPEGGVVETVQKGGSVRRVPVDGARELWKRLLAGWNEGASVAEWICPTSTWGAEGGGGAYQRLRRHLQRLGEDLKLDGRNHLHRFRRTVAVRALEETQDLHLVQQLLGHKSIASTQVYTDELRERGIAELQQKLLGRKKVHE